MKTFKDHLDESLRKPIGVDYLRKSRSHNSVDPYKLDDDWNVLGSGAAGSTFARDGDKYIVKVFNTSDEGYKLWLMFCLRNQHNSYIPKIIGRPVPINKALAAVRLERLYPMRNGVELMQLMDWWSEYRRLVKVKATTKEFDSLNKMWTWHQKREEFLKIMAFIDNHRYNDIRSDNVMRRGGALSNPTMVFTDPLYGNAEKIPTKYSKELKQFLDSRFPVTRYISPVLEPEFGG